MTGQPNFSLQPITLEPFYLSLMPTMYFYFCAENDLCRKIREQLSGVTEVVIADNYLSPAKVAAELGAQQGGSHFVFYEHPAVSIAGMPSASNIDLLLADVLETAKELAELKSVSEDVALVCLDSLPRTKHGEVATFEKDLETTLTELAGHRLPPTATLSNYREALIRAVLMSDQKASQALVALENHSLNVNRDDFVQLSPLLYELRSNAIEEQHHELTVSILRDCQLRADRSEYWLNAVQSSISWRLTAPVRQTMSFLKSVLRKLPRV